MAHGTPGLPGKHRKTKTGRKYRRSQRRVRWPLMPDGLTREQAWKWFVNKYAHDRKNSLP